MVSTIEEYRDYLQNYLHDTFNDYNSFELIRESDFADHYKSDRLLQILELIELCNSFFNENVKETEDLIKYTNFLEDLSMKYIDSNTETFVIGTISLPIFNLFQGE